MEPKVLILITLLALVASSACPEPGFWGENGNLPGAAEIAAKMSAGELVGQTFMVGYTGTYPDEEFLDFIETYGVGGVKIFGWNTSDLEEMASGIAAMQLRAFESRHHIPLLVATDQEGGWVRHVKGPTSDTPGNLAIGSSGLAIDAYEAGLLIGHELAVLGINMNFAPTVDVYTHPDADVIGPRAFSANPVETGFLGLGFFRGLEQAGVLATAKHFPGHGNTADDSHGILPVIHDTFETLWDRDLIPYRMMIPEGLPAIMSGHLSFPDVTGSVEPATLSPVFLTDILRNQIGFEGIIITDDMRMYGVLQNGMELPEACRLAIVAGNDMLLISRDFELQIEILEYLTEYAEADPSFRKMLEVAAARIIGMKQRYLGDLTPESLRPDPGRVETDLPYAEGQPGLFDLACRSVAVARPYNVPLPSRYSSNEGKGLLLVGQYSAFMAEGEKRFPKADTEFVSFDRSSDTQIRRIAARISRAEHTVFCLANEESLEVLKGLEALAGKITVFSVLTPIYLRETPWVTSAIATFGRGVLSFKAGFAVLSGDYVPEGTVPISLDAE